MPNPKPTPPLTPEIIAAHERLHPRIAALLKQVERFSGRAALQPVSLETLQLARALTREAARLLGTRADAIGLRHASAAAPPDHQALAVALGQVLAGLESFEAAHTKLSAKHQAVCWHLPDGGTVPVSRLRPAQPPRQRPGGFAAGATAPEEDPKKLRQRILSRFIRRENYVYMQGYADGKSGRPPREPLDEFMPVP